MLKNNKAKIKPIIPGSQPNKKGIGLLPIKKIFLFLFIIISTIKANKMY